MNRVLEDIQPKNVFRFFEDICNIPHGSGNVEKISRYLVDFAKERGLDYRQDENFNVVIRKPATKGSTGAPVIIQGHMDMVAVKTPDKDKDMENEGLDLLVDGDYIKADRTSLGGDDGIAVAMRAINREQKQEVPQYEEMCRRFLADSKDFSEEKIKEAGINQRFSNDGTIEDCIRDIKEAIKQQLL